MCGFNLNYSDRTPDSDSTGAQRNVISHFLDFKSGGEVTLTSLWNKSVMLFSEPWSQAMTFPLNKMHMNGSHFLEYHTMLEHAVHAKCSLTCK